jgi:hypothetical protein
MCSYLWLKVLQLEWLAGVVVVHRDEVAAVLFIVLLPAHCIGDAVRHVLARLTQLQV